MSLSKRRFAISRLRLPIPSASSLTCPPDEEYDRKSPTFSKSKLRKTITAVPHSERRKSSSWGPNYNILIPGIRAYCMGLSSLNSWGPSSKLLSREISFMGQWAADQLQWEPGCWKQVGPRHASLKLPVLSVNPEDSRYANTANCSFCDWMQKYFLHASHIHECFYTQSKIMQNFKSRSI